MKTLIIEDETLTGKRLEGLLHQYDPAIAVLAILPSVEAAVRWFQVNPLPDLVFMDIHLEDDLAFRIFERVKLDVPVIFTTAYDEYTIQAFKVNSIDYLLKPINPGELAQALEKYKALHNQRRNPDLDTLLRLIGKKEPEYRSRFMVTAGSRIKSIEVEEVAYFYSEDKLTFLATREGQHYPLDISLEKLQPQLNPRDFFRISRQFIVGFPSIQTVHAHFKGKLKLDLLPRSKTEVQVSGDRSSEFKDWLGR